jgi:hypothetical protein
MYGSRNDKQSTTSLCSGQRTGASNRDIDTYLTIIESGRNCAAILRAALFNESPVIKVRSP